MIGRRAALRRVACGAAALAGGLVSTGAVATPLEKVRARGALVVALYNDMPPFHAAGQGIDVDLAGGLAAALGVKLTVLPFNADENMADDLRNMVWKGHYLGFGPADVLLHVPVDRPLMEANPQVSVFAPYYRDRVAIARRLDRVPVLDTLDKLGKEPVAVPGQSLAGWLMLGADSGAYREQLRTQFKDGVEAAQLLHKGEVAVAAGLLSELESVLRGDARFAIEAMPSPRAPREGWAVGMAVKKASSDLAQALQAATNEMARDGRIGQFFARGNVSWRAV